MAKASGLIQGRKAEDKEREELKVKLLRRQAAIIRDYADAIHEDVDYVIGFVADEMLAKDKVLIDFRAARGGSPETPSVASADAPAAVGRRKATAPLDAASVASTATSPAASKTPTVDAGPVKSGWGGDRKAAVGA